MASGKITKHEIDGIIREEVARWISNLWQVPTRYVDYSLNDGLDPFLFSPNRAHETDAGADLRATEEIVVPAGGSACVGTGVHIKLPPHTCGLLVSKSGLNVVNSLTSTGLIDEGYTGEIIVKIYNHGSEDYKFEVGDKISQLVIIPCLYPMFVLRESIDGGERGDSGFGSTGR